METITLICGRKKVVCSNPVYYARSGGERSERLVPSHVVAWPQADVTLREVSYVQLKDARVPVLVDCQPDGSVWLGGAYLDVVAGELRLIPRPVPDEMRGKSKEWLKAVDDRWQVSHQTSPQTTGNSPGPGWNGYPDKVKNPKSSRLRRAGEE